MKRPGVQIVSITVAGDTRSETVVIQNMIQNSMFPMFFMSDALRRSLGSLFDGAGLAPQQASWRVVLDQSEFRLRRYGRQGAPAGPVLIVPAPIKRPYIFDLLPEVSIIRRLTEGGFSVYLTQWREQKS